MHTKLNCFHVLIFKYTLTLLLLITVKTRTVRYNEAPRLGSTQKRNQKPEAKLNEPHGQARVSIPSVEFSFQNRNREPTGDSLVSGCGCCILQDNNYRRI